MPASGCVFPGICECVCVCVCVCVGTWVVGEKLDVSYRILWVSVAEQK